MTSGACHSNGESHYNKPEVNRRASNLLFSFSRPSPEEVIRKAKFEVRKQQ